MPSLDETPEQGAEEAIVEHKVNYDYLLSMPISSLTLEKVSHPHAGGLLTPRELGQRCHVSASIDLGLVA